MMTLTFKPKLNEKHLPKQGTLNILSQPDTYLQRVQSKAKEQSEKQRLAIYEQEVEQFAECTFKPKVHDAPAYVTVRLMRVSIQSTVIFNAVCTIAYCSEYGLSKSSKSRWYWSTRSETLLEVILI